MKEKQLYYGTCIANIVITVITEILLYKYNLVDFIIKDSYIDNYLHRTLFSHLAEQILVVSSLFAFWCFVIAIVLTVISMILRNCRNYLGAYRFLFAGVVTNILTFLVFMLTNMILGNCRIESGIWVLTIATVLLIAGGLVIYLGTPELIKGRKKLWDILIAVGILAVCSCIIMIPTLMSVKEDFKYAKELRSVISSQPDSFEEETEVQIGNYYTGLSVYAENKIYYMHGVDAYNIKTVDKDGNAEEFWRTKDETLNRGIFYEGGYLYVSVDSLNEAKNQLLRISLESGTEEIIYESNSYFFFGVADNKVFFTTPKDENGLCEVRYFDLTAENLGESSVLYDKDVDYYNLSHNIFVSRYLYNDSSEAMKSVSWLLSYDEIIIYEGNAYRMTARNGWKESTDLEMIHYHNSQYVETLIDNEVMCYSIYDDKLYYVKEKDDTAYEVICCDLQGNNKTTIGTITKEKETYCRYMAVGEGFIMLKMSGDSELEYASHAFYMKLEDGSSSQLY